MSQVVTWLSGINSRTRWQIWLIYFLLWTTGLVSPIPWQPSWKVEALELDLKFFVTKGLHLSAYAVLTILAGWLAAPARWRWLLLFVLLVHAPLTEAIQTYVPGRTGSLRDVLIDTSGISLGLLISWRWWSAADKDSPPQKG